MLVVVVTSLESAANLEQVIENYLGRDTAPEAGSPSSTNIKIVSRDSPHKTGMCGGVGGGGGG